MERPTGLRIDSHLTGVVQARINEEVDDRQVGIVRWLEAMQIRSTSIRLHLDESSVRKGRIPEAEAE